MLKNTKTDYYILYLLDVWLIDAAVSTMTGHIFNPPVEIQPHTLVNKVIAYVTVSRLVMQLMILMDFCQKSTYVETTTGRNPQPRLTSHTCIVSHVNSNLHSKFFPLPCVECHACLKL